MAPSSSSARASGGSAGTGGDLRVGDRTLCYDGTGGVRGVVTRVLPWVTGLRRGFTYFVTHDSGAVGEFHPDDIAQGYLCRA